MLSAWGMLLFFHYLLAAQVLIGLLEIKLFVGLDHELVENNHIGIRQVLHRPDAQAHNGVTILDHLDVAFGARHTIDALGAGWAGDFQVATPDKLAALLSGERIAQKTGGSSFSRRKPPKIGLKDQPYHRRDGEQYYNPTQQCLNLLREKHHPPTTRGTSTICSAVSSNVSMRCAGLPGSSLKAVAPFARSCAKMRSASRTAARASGSPT